MTATAVANNSQLQPMGEQAVPAALSFPLVASAQLGKHQFLILSPSTGYGSLADDATPHQISGGFGFPDELSATNAVDAQAVARTNQRWCTVPVSTINGDNLTAADVGVPFWIADGNTPGKLSHASGKDRSLGGLCFGVAQPGETPVRVWSGPVAQAIARGVMLANAASGGFVAYPVDASASTDIGSTTVSTNALMIPRSKTHGVIQSIELIPSAALSATSGSDRQVTVFKVDTLGVAADAIVGTFITTTALVAHQPVSFTLGSAADLHMLETDILCYSTVHASGGAVIPQSALRVNMKAI